MIPLDQIISGIKCSIGFLIIKMQDPEICSVLDDVSVLIGKEDLFVTDNMRPVDLMEVEIQKDRFIVDVASDPVIKQSSISAVDLYRADM